MLKLFDLLRDGYFPRESPSPFTTAPFADLVFSNSAFFTYLFRKEIQIEYFGNRRDEASNTSSQLDVKRSRRNPELEEEDIR